MDSLEYTNDKILTLMRGASQGDSNAFDTIYRHVYAPIYQYIHYRVGHNKDAEDIVQSVFLRAYTGIARSETEGKIPLAYLYTVARNAVIDYWQRKKEILMRDSQAMPLAGGIVGDVPFEQIAETDPRKKEVLAAVAHLTSEQQEVIINTFINHFSVKETAQVMGKTEIDVRGLQVKALQTLQGFIKE